MSEQKQILILEDLGVSKSLVAKLALSMDINFELVWDTETAKKEKVEVLVTVKNKVDKPVLKKFSSVKVVAVAFTGYDAVDTEYCQENNIAVYNVPTYSTKSVSELTIGLALSLLREIPKSFDHIKNKEWELQPGLELAGKTIGILGTGTIGLNTAKLFKAFGCNLVGWSRSKKEEFESLDGMYIEDKKEFFAACDIITINVPLNSKTTGLVGEPELKAMKETAFLINTARGPIVDEKALIEALKNKTIAGAGIDVFAQEPIEEDNPLIALDNVILTPHIAYKTEEALGRRARTTFENIRDFFEGSDTNRVA